VVRADVEANAVAVGVPARIVSSRAERAAGSL
jgi:acetyltransferase-like isoleucine patch superfamily enzyme